MGSIDSQREWQLQGTLSPSASLREERHMKQLNPGLHTAPARRTWRTATP